MIKFRLGVALLVACAFSPVFGATRTWTGGGSTSNWSEAANWGGTAPVPGDDLVFPAGSYLNNDYATGTEFHSITVDSAFLTLSGNAISLGSGGFTSTASNLVQVDFPISLSAAQTWSAEIVVFMRAPLAINSNTVTFDSQQGFVFFADVSGEGTMIVTRGFVAIQAATTFTGDVIINGGGISVFGGSITAPIVQTSGNLSFSNATVGSLDISGGTIAPGNAGNGPNSSIGNSGSVLLGPDVRYFQTVASDDPSDGFANLHVTGTVNLGGAMLELSSSGMSPGTKLVFIENDGEDPTVGTFGGLPEGAMITNDSRSYRISYVAGTGNDVALTALVPTTITLSSSPNPSFGGQEVTLTAMVASPGSVPSGTVTFFDGTTPLGTATLTDGGVATITVSSLLVGSPPRNVPTLSAWAMAALACALAMIGVFARQ